MSNFTTVPACCLSLIIFAELLVVVRLGFWMLLIWGLSLFREGRR
jgi:hypothetical protein